MAFGMLIGAAGCASGSNQLAAAHSGKEPLSNPPQSLSPTTGATTATIPTASVGATTASFTVSFGNGYTASVTFALGALQHVTNVQLAGTVLESATDDACTFNFQTDAVVPFLATVTNTTSGFSFSSLMPGFSLLAIGNNEEADYLQGAYSTTSGPECDTSANLAGWQLDNLAPGQSAQLGGFIGINNYYSPADPQGDPGLINQVGLLFGTPNGSASVSSGELECPPSLSLLISGVVLALAGGQPSGSLNSLLTSDGCG
jgi:hypothetical protein